ncbi:MAG: hypothetical protein ACRD8O_07895 [Bryobacteraceae bacterium]
MTGGNGDNTPSRLDRIEAALESIIRGREEFRAGHKMLLKSQVLMREAMEKGHAKFRERMDEITDKLNRLTGAVGQLPGRVDQTHHDIAAMRENFDARLKRVEG